MNYILMADIIESSQKSGEEVMTQFKKLVNETNRSHSAEILSPLTITLGDEFQGVLKSLPAALEAIFSMEEEIIKSQLVFNLRYVLHFGKIDTGLNPLRSYEMLGPGLSFARKQLDEIKKEGKKVFVSGLNDKQNIEINLAFELYQSLKEGWPLKDVEEVGRFIELEDYKLVAKAMKKDTSSAWRKEKTLRIKDYFRIKKLIISLAA